MHQLTLPNLETPQITRLTTVLRAREPWIGVDSDGDPTTDTRTPDDLMANEVMLHFGQLVLGHEGALAKRGVRPF